MCEHMNFAARVNVIRMSHEEGGPITGYMSEITINCADCGKPFQFLGLEAGLDTQGARVGVDGLEARIALCPEGARPNPLQQMSFGIRRFDG
jgi:hypothetical protein